MRKSYPKFKTSASHRYRFFYFLSALFRVYIELLEMFAPSMLHNKDIPLGMLSGGFLPPNLHIYENGLSTFEIAFHFKRFRKKAIPPLFSHYNRDKAFNTVICHRRQLIQSFYVSGSHFTCITLWKLDRFFRVFPSKGTHIFFLQLFCNNLASSSWGLKWKFGHWSKEVRLCIALTEIKEKEGKRESNKVSASLNPWSKVFRI